MAGSSEPAFLFCGIKMERCTIDDYSSILQRPLFSINKFKKVFTFVRKYVAALAAKETAKAALVIKNQLDYKEDDA